MRAVPAIVIITALGVSGSINTKASDLSLAVFDTRLDRFYFPSGEEALVFENAPFAIVRGDDTVFTGCIEHAWQGVSVSAPTRGFADTLTLSGLTVRVHQAEIDSGAMITIGSDLAGLPLGADTATSERVRWIEYRDPGAMREDFAAGVIDAVVSFSDVASGTDGAATVAVPSPFLVVMVPQVGRPFNYRGELTTSLYYRFDESRLALCFGGDGAKIVSRLKAADPALASSRLYAFDPARGKKLFDRMTSRPSRVRLYAGHPSLVGLTRYFADILSRDRCAVEIGRGDGARDVSLVFVPYSERSPRAAADSLCSMLARDTAAGTPAAEYLRRIGLELRGLDIALQPADSLRHFETIDRILAEDIGVFPLFRPTLFIQTQKRLRGVTLAPDGTADFSSAFRVVLPAKPSGGPR